MGPFKACCFLEAYANRHKIPGATSCQTVGFLINRPKWQTYVCRCAGRWVVPRASVLQNTVLCDVAWGCRRKRKCAFTRNINCCQWLGQKPTAKQTKSRKPKNGKSTNKQPVYATHHPTTLLAPLAGPTSAG